MNSVALAAERVRARLADSRLSYREVAKKAGLSNSTVREFALSGNARLETVARIEAVIQDIGGQSATSRTSVADCDVQ